MFFVIRWVYARGKDVFPVLWLYGHTFGWVKRRSYLYETVHILSLFVTGLFVLSV